MPDIDLSVVMPCLNEVDTLEGCIKQCLEAFRAYGIRGEVIVADNGSTDGSMEIAERCGARLVRVPQNPIKSRNGYGNGLMHGIAAARAPYVLMGDSDGSYDFGDMHKFLAKLRDGHDLVQGCRLPSGGGSIKPGAMPWSHRWIGNPMFSVLVRTWFGAQITDVNCGLRAFRKDWYERIDQRCTGMEFAAEMIIKSGVFKARVAEVPITLSPDGRKARKPHLKTFRDGWRIQRLLFLYSPTWLYLVPGLVLVLLGLVGYAIALPGVKIGQIQPDATTLLFSSVFILCGYQSFLYSMLSKTFAINEGLMPESAGLLKFYQMVNLERGIMAGLVSFVLGSGLAFYALWSWAGADFGQLEYAQVLRVAIPGALFIVLGMQTVFSSFFASVLGMGKR
jgi:glycosyltransferase involved in cell wall biosynthesis